jgi:glycosyltransferase involved in cell wall biosynthesis
MEAALNGTWSNHSGFLAAELARRLPAEVHVEPAARFFPFGHTADGIAALLARCDEVPDGAVSMHLWAHLWWEPRRRDFSDVHAGSLTPRRIRMHDTTYNLLARPLLPALALEEEARRLGHLAYWSMHERSGYGTAARRLILALDAAGVDLSYRPMTRTAAETVDTPRRTASLGDPELDVLLRERGQPDVVVGHMTPEYYPVLRSAHPEARLVGHTVWETERLPRHWPDLMEIPDLLVVPCRWNAETIRADGVSTPVAVVPHVAGIPSRRSRPTWDWIPDDAFVFYTIATWTSRKAVASTIRAYLEAFREDEPVVLVVKTSQFDFSYVGRAVETLVQPGTSGWAAAQVLKDYRRPAPIRLVTRDLGEDDIEALHTRGDCFVSLCRSEGWGIPSFDAAAYGNPVVITGYGGQLDYLDPDRAHLVEYSLVEVEDPTGLPSYTPDQRWAEPSVAHGAELLRNVYEHPTDARERAEALSRDLLVRYRPEAVAKEFVRALASAETPRS